MLLVSRSLSRSLSLSLFLSLSLALSLSLSLSVPDTLSFHDSACSFLFEIRVRKTRLCPRSHYQELRQEEHGSREPSRRKELSAPPLALGLSLPKLRCSHSQRLRRDPQISDLLRLRGGLGERLRGVGRQLEMLREGRKCKSQRPRPVDNDLTTLPPEAKPNRKSGFGLLFGTLPGRPLPLKTRRRSPCRRIRHIRHRTPDPDKCRGLKCNLNAVPRSAELQGIRGARQVSVVRRSFKFWAVPLFQKGSKAKTLGRCKE